MTNLDQEIRATRSAMFSAMGEGFTDTPESVKIETRLRELESMRPARVPVDTIGNVFLSVYA